MADIIKFNVIKAGLAAAEVPDVELVRHDEYGRPLYCYLLEYQHDGITFGLDFWAYTETDAQAHLLSMVAHLTYVGQKFAMVPA